MNNPNVGVRAPQAALWGFYPINPSSLIKAIENCFKNPRFGPGRLPSKSSRIDEGPVVAGVAPHAGYEFSGPCAAWLYLELAERVPKIDTFVILGSNHTGFGSTFTTTKRFEKWATPLGEVRVDTVFLEELEKEYPALVDDVAAHMREHSIEVQLPFLQYLYENEFELVPIVVKHVEYEEAKEFARAILSVVQKLGRTTVVIASSDFTHHGAYYGYVIFRENVVENVKRLDLEFVKVIEALDTKKFLNMIRRYDSTICGYGAIAVAMEYAKLVNARAKLLKYYNSGEVTGEEDMVVGYASIAFEKR